MADLRDNGIELSGADVGLIREVVHEHLEYFQMMLGYEPREREVVSLIRHETGRPATGGPTTRRGGEHHN